MGHAGIAKFRKSTVTSGKHLLGASILETIAFLFGVNRRGCRAWLLCCKHVSCLLCQCTEMLSMLWLLEFCLCVILWLPFFWCFWLHHIMNFFVLKWSFSLARCGIFPEQVGYVKKTSCVLVSRCWNFGTIAHVNFLSCQENIRTVQTSEFFVLFLFSNNVHNFATNIRGYELLNRHFSPQHTWCHWEP